MTFVYCKRFAHAEKMDLVISYRKQGYILLLLIIVASHSAFGYFNNGKAINLLPFLNDLDSDSDEALEYITRSLTSGDDDNSMYHIDSMLPNLEDTIEKSSEFDDLRGKRAWEEVNWKPPKRAWGIVKRAWEILDAMKTADRWNVKGKRNKEQLIDVPIQTPDFVPWVDERANDDVINDNPIDWDTFDVAYDKRGWEAFPRLFRCGCCSRKAESACCSVCRALTTNKRNINLEHTESLRSFTCRCCKSIWYHTDECCFMCKLFSDSTEGR